MNLKIHRIIKQWKSPELFEMPNGDFLNNGKGRRFLSHENSPFRLEAFSSFGIFNLNREPMFKNFIGNHFLDGTFTHKHIDLSPQGFAHVRCNWMLKKPLQGGDPILDDEVFHVEEGDLWICFASMEHHSSTPIYDGERLIYSFGALVNKDDLTHILYSK